MKYYLQIKNNEPILYEGDKVISEGIKVNLSQLSEEVKKAIGWVDVEDAAKRQWGENNSLYYTAFIEGAKFIQSLNEGRFNDDDIRIAIELYRRHGLNVDKTIPQNVDALKSKVIEIIKSIEPKLFECEIETEERKQFCGRDNEGNILYDIVTSPRIENNSITVLKVKV